MAKKQHEPEFEFSGGRLCLDFANTVTARSSAPQEKLQSYADLVSWGRQAGVRAPKGYRIASLSPRDRGAQSRILEQALAVREAIYGVFSSCAARRRPSSADLDQLWRAYVECLKSSRLAWEKGAFRWEHADPEELDPVVRAVVCSAIELLFSPDLERIRECASESCDWLFMDFSRNGSRRWCDMNVCGNRAKVRRFRERHS